MNVSDIEYLRENNLPSYLEALALAILTEKPKDVDDFLLQRITATMGGSPLSAFKLFVVFPCPYCAVVLMTASWCNAQCEITEVKGSQYNEFRALSPFGKAPVLAGGPITVLECGPIVRYIVSSSKQNKRIDPSVDSAFEAIQNNILLHASHLMNQTVFGTMAGSTLPSEASIQGYVANFLSVLETVEKSQIFFSGSQWLVGTSLSVADFCLVAAVWAVHITAGFECLSKFPRISAWWTAVTKESPVSSAMQPYLPYARK